MEKVMRRWMGACTSISSSTYGTEQNRLEVLLLLLECTILRYQMLLSDPAAIMLECLDVWCVCCLLRVVLSCHITGLYPWNCFPYSYCPVVYTRCYTGIQFIAPKTCDCRSFKRMTTFLSFGRFYFLRHIFGWWTVSFSPQNIWVQSQET